MTTKEKIESFLRDVIGVGEDKIFELTDTFYDLGVDELDIVELIMELESILNIVISDKEVDNFHTVGDVVRYLEKHNITST